MISNLELKWVPVNEGLPKTDDEVLATDGYDMFTAYYYVDKWCSYDRRYDEYHHPIIAWYPLPQVYKAERSGSK